MTGVQTCALPISTSWRNTTGFYKERIFDHSVWAMGALAIGIGIVPMLVGIAALARPKDEPRDPQTRAFVVTSVAALAVFLGYAGIKGAYISTVFATLVVERNVIYLGPVLYAATARRARRWSRSEERRVGKECSELCRSRWSPYH